MCLPVGEFVLAPVTIVDGFTHALLKLNESWLPYVPVWHALNVITVVRGCNLPQTATDWTRLQLLLCLLHQRHTPTSTGCLLGWGFISTIMYEDAHMRTH